MLAYRPPDTVEDAHGRGDIRDRDTIDNDVDHDGNKSMLLDVEWTRVQGKRVAKRGETISRKDPF